MGAGVMTHSRSPTPQINLYFYSTLFQVVLEKILE